MSYGSADDPWSHPPERVSLGERAVHVWRLRLDQLAGRGEGLKSLLNTDERARAERYFFTRDRDWFIGRRGILRRLLSIYLEMPASEVRFSFTKFGKPYLEEGPLRFNISHSAGLAIYAFTLASEIGVDIEHWRADFDPMKLAERYFSISEIEALRSLPEEERIPGFYAGWTRKEAFIKAHGEGLSLPLDLFDVTLEPGEGARLAATRGDLEPADQWTLKDIPIGMGFSAALVVQGAPLEYDYWEVENPIA